MCVDEPFEAHELVLSRLPRSEMPVLCDSLPYYARLQKLVPWWRGGGRLESTWPVKRNSLALDGLVGLV